MTQSAVDQGDAPLAPATWAPEMYGAIKALILKRQTELLRLEALLQRDLFRELSLSVRALALATRSAGEVRTAARSILERRRDLVKVEIDWLCVLLSSRAAPGPLY